MRRPAGRVGFDLRRSLGHGGQQILEGLLAPQISPPDTRYREPITVKAKPKAISSGFFGSENAAQAEANRLNKIARE